MYIYLVILFLIFTIGYTYYKKEARKEGMADPVDMQMANFNETDAYIPNRVGGTRGEDLTFMGNIRTEGDNGLELGQNINKGVNSGKIRYNEQSGEVQLYGAGAEGSPYKIKLMDTVEVGDLLQSKRANVRGPLVFGKEDGTEGNIQKEDQQLTIRGYGADGERKVKIWDEVEVGKLMTTRGMDVRGSLNAYNDVNVDGIITAKGKIFAKDVTLIGDLDISGNVYNKRFDNMNTSLDTLNKRIDDFDRPSISKSIEDTRKEAINGISSAVTTLRAESAADKTNTLQTLRREANVSNGMMRTEFNTAIQAMLNSKNASHNAMNMSIQNLSTSLDKAVLDIKLSNSAEIKNYFDDVILQINNASKNTAATTGTMSATLLSHTADINNVSAKLAVAQQDIRNVSKYASDQYLLGTSNMNTSVNSVKAVLDRFQLDQSGKNATQITLLNAIDVNLRELNASKVTFGNAVNEWNTSKRSLGDAAAGWYAKSDFFNKAAESWNNLSGGIVTPNDSWTPGKGSKLNELWNTSRAFAVQDLVIPNTITLGSGTSKWTLNPTPDKLIIKKP